MITLQYFVPSDFQQLISWSGDEAFLLQWAGPEFKYPLTEDQLLEYIKGANDIERSHRLIYKAMETETNQTVGHISIGRIERDNRSARIGKVLIGNKSSRGKGDGTQIMQQALRIGFEELHLHRISLGVFDFNESARKCYGKTGLRSRRRNKGCKAVSRFLLELDRDEYIRRRMEKHEIALWIDEASQER
jgi:RimJ/RimL family protein N-acetyltransferase